MLQLFRDVLDKQLKDREQCKIGRVDRLVLEIGDGKPPRVTRIEVGVAALAARLGERFGKWVAGAGRKRGQKHREAYRIPWSKVTDVGLDVVVSLDSKRTELAETDRYLRERLIGRLPGGH